MFGIKKIKKRLIWLENEIEYNKAQIEQKEENEKRKPEYQLTIPIINKNDLCEP